MGMKERMFTGELYYPNEESIFDEQLKKLDLLYEFNSTRPTEQKKRQELMKEMFAEIGENCYLEPPFHANWGGAHMHLGDSVYANFNFTAVDDSHIYIGSYTMIGPNVTVATAGHPILPELREKAYQFNMPVHIGRNCWIGAGAVIMPGVTIGDNSVIGAGSVVTVKDITAIAKIDASFGYNYLEAYLVIFFVYILLCTLVQLVFHVLERNVASYKKLITA